ncbi:MAG: CpsD/CapB family tyrosine-protein kinase [Chloroflexi bacterium]|nr:CpsD/CapB family tyrosine-protein kinase [Chloroflexota bacterium]
MAAIAQEVVVVSHPQSPAAEEFRRLRTNIQFSGIDHPLRSVAVVAPHAYSGRSVVAVNLAAAFGQAGKQTVLVDADLLRPTQHLLLGSRISPGLTDVIAGNADLGEAVVATDIPLLRLLPAGTPVDNPVITLNSTRLQGVLAQLAEFADIVVFDTPSLAELTDTALFAANADGTLLVIDSGKTRRNDGLDAKALLERVHAHVLGAVVTHPAHQVGFLQRLLGAA